MDAKDIKQQYYLLYNKVAKPIYDISTMYSQSALFIENKLVEKNVVKAFDILKKEIKQQLDILREDFKFKIEQNEVDKTKCK